jgi:hypothetical protein
LLADDAHVRHSALPALRMLSVLPTPNRRKLLRSPTGTDRPAVPAGRVTGALAQVRRERTGIPPKNKPIQRRHVCVGGRPDLPRMYGFAPPACTGMMGHYLAARDAVQRAGDYSGPYYFGDSAPTSIPQCAMTKSLKGERMPNGVCPFLWCG